MEYDFTITIRKEKENFSAYVLMFDDWKDCKIDEYSTLEKALESVQGLIIEGKTLQQYIDGLVKQGKQFPRGHGSHFTTLTPVTPKNMDETSLLAVLEPHKNTQGERCYRSYIPALWPECRIEKNESRGNVDEERDSLIYKLKQYANESEMSPDTFVSGKYFLIRVSAEISD